MRGVGDGVDLSRWRLTFAYLDLGNRQCRVPLSHLRPTIVVASGTVDVGRVSWHTSTVMEDHFYCQSYPRDHRELWIMAGRSFDTFGPSSLPLAIRALLSRKQWVRARRSRSDCGRARHSPSRSRLQTHWEYRIPHRQYRPDSAPPRVFSTP